MLSGTEIFAHKISDSRLMILSQNKKAMGDGKIQIFPWQEGLKKIFNDFRA